MTISTRWLSLSLFGALTFGLPGIAAGASPAEKEVGPGALDEVGEMGAAEAPEQRGEALEAGEVGPVGPVRIVGGRAWAEPEPVAAPVPDVAPAPTADVAPAPTVDVAPTPSKRPDVGTVGIWLGGGLLTLSTGMLVGALVGDELAGLDRDSRAALAGTSPLVALLGFGTLLVGIDRREKFSDWAEAHGRSPTKDGTGLILGGMTVAAGFGLGLGVVVSDGAAAGPDVDREAAGGVLGLGATIGTLTMIGGIVRRAKFTRWDRRVRGLSVAPLSQRRTAGLSVSGRF